MAARPGTTSTLASFLTTGYYAAIGEAPRHWDLPSDGTLTVNLSGLDGAGRSLARAALDAWEMVAGVRFQETAGAAKITFDDAGAKADTSSSYNPQTGEMLSAQVEVGAGWLDRYGATVGSYGFQTYLHEVGHALGLGHPGTYGGGATYAGATWANDSWQRTVMSYLDQDENPNVRAAKAYVVTPMMADVAAARQLYGAPEGGATAGDTRYGEGSSLGHLAGVFGPGPGDLASNALTVVDVGGTDTFDFSDSGAAQAISLRQGALSSVHGQKDNLGIAWGTTIERAHGGSGADGINGNGSANVLKGNGGSDNLRGGGGADSLYGGSGGDALRGGSGNDRAWGGAGRDGLKGQAGDDRLRGGDGADRLAGGSGDDRLSGGGGRDRFVFSKGSDVVTDFKNDADTLVLDDALWGGGFRTAGRLLDYARHEDGAVAFDFGNGNTLRLEGGIRIGDLADDLAIG